MRKLNLFQEETLLVTTLFRQFFIGTQVAAAGGILNLIFFSDQLVDKGNILFFRLDFIAFVIGAIATSLLHSMLGQGKDLKVITAFLSLWAVIMAFTTWFEGGLYGTLLLSFPILFIFAAIFTEGVAFLSICSFLSAVIALMGLNHIYDWLPSPEGMVLDVIPRILSILMLNTLAAYACWVFGRLLKSSFDDLKLENKRVIESQRLISKLADYDGLTGSLNRVGAESRCQKLLNEIDFGHECVVAYFIDLDNFKTINDLFDHSAGDQLLVTISQRLEVLLPENGFACRFGGDEFVLVLKVEHDFDGEGFADKIIKSLAKPYTIFGTEVEITASVGIADDCKDLPNFDSICKRADVAMYKAKQSGKNKHHTYSDQLQHDYMRNLNILNCLKDAISHEQLDLFFQPKVNLQSNQVEGAEALLRWNRGNDERIGPDEFIPVIESTELIHSVGAWVINEACRACKQWQRAGAPIKVAVNVSALQLTRTSFSQTVADALSQNGLSPDYLEIEITEHSLIIEAPVVQAQLEALKTLGVTLAIDDFGTGYSNMGYLTQLKIDVLKLDRSFVSQVSQSEEYYTVVTAIIKMAKVLGMEVVAEGIETAIERDALKALGCDLGQGFFWSRAVPGLELLSIIDDSSLKISRF